MAEVAELSPEEIRNRVQALPMTTAQAISVARAEEVPNKIEQTKERYRFVRPFAAAADSLIEYLQNTEGRVMLGLPEIDVLTRGFGRGELIYITGYTNAGKTQVFLTAVLHNRDRRIVLFTPDEPAELVLTKLVCMRSNSNAENLERRIKENDQEAIDRVRRIARTDFSNLIVVDEALGFADMAAALKEAEDYWGERVDAVGIDYLELIPSEDREIEKKSQDLKRWTKDMDVPVLCLHQGSRGNAGHGQKLTMGSMKYGGEAEAIFVLGVRRLRDDESLDAFLREQHEDTVNVAVLKSKRPPSRRGEFTFHMDPACGVIRPQHKDDPELF